MGVENSIFGCKGICDIILFYLDYQFEWIYSIYTNECYFCYRPDYRQTVCSWTVTDLDRKVRAAAIIFLNLETHIQICMIYVVVSDSGLHQRIMVDTGLSVELKMWGNIWG
jgi:hypothetical protein